MRVWDVRLDLPKIKEAHPAALLHFECGARDEAWRARYPDSARYRQQVIDQYRMQVIDELVWSNRCTLVWMAPR